MKKANARLRQAVSDLTLDKLILQQAPGETFESPASWSCIDHIKTMMRITPSFLNIFAFTLALWVLLSSAVAAGLHERKPLTLYTGDTIRWTANDRTVGCPS